MENYFVITTFKDDNITTLAFSLTVALPLVNTDVNN